jgi:hypothetical protein
LARLDVPAVRNAIQDSSLKIPSMWYSHQHFLCKFEQQNNPKGNYSSTHFLKVEFMEKYSILYEIFEFTKLVTPWIHFIIRYWMYLLLEYSRN